MNTMWQKCIAKIKYFLHQGYWRFKHIQTNLWWKLFKDKPIGNLVWWEQKTFSQNGEDGIIKILLYKVQAVTSHCVEIGVGDGTECNTRKLVDNDNWTYLYFDASDQKKPNKKIIQKKVTAENICLFLEENKTPIAFDLLSIDIDSNDYWIWKALKPYRPRIVVIEYNSSIGPHEKKTIPYDPSYVWDGTTYFGASLAALADLGNELGYTLVGCDSQGVNAFFVRSDLTKHHFVLRTLFSMYRKPRYGKKQPNGLRGHPPSTRPMISIEN